MLFDTHCSIDHLKQIVRCIGAPPSDLLDMIDDDVWMDYFDQRGALNMYKAKISSVQCRKLETYFRNCDQKCCELYDLCRKMLTWDPSGRITARQTLKHLVFRHCKG